MQQITKFGLEPGQVLAHKYVVTKKIAAAWDGEVYLTKETATGIERAAKLFFPHHNPKNRTAKKYANKLHNLRQCQAVVQYHSYELIKHQEQEVTCLVSEYVSGMLLADFQILNNGKIHYYEALQIIYEVAKALENIHQSGSYHGNIQPSNIILRQRGLRFDIKLVDCVDSAGSRRDNVKKDIYDLLRLYYRLIGGKTAYSRLPDCMKKMLMGMRRTRLEESFKNVSSFVDYVENIQWQ